jgi:hypothetical protein
LARHFVNYWIVNYEILDALMKTNHMDIMFTCYLIIRCICMSYIGLHLSFFQRLTDISYLR